MSCRIQSLGPRIEVQDLGDQQHACPSVGSEVLLRKQPLTSSALASLGPALLSARCTSLRPCAWVCSRSSSAPGNVSIRSSITEEGAPAANVTFFLLTLVCDEAWPHGPKSYHFATHSTRIWIAPAAQITQSSAEIAREDAWRSCGACLFSAGVPAASEVGCRRRRPGGGNLRSASARPCHYYHHHTHGHIPLER